MVYKTVLKVKHCFIYKLSYICHSTGWPKNLEFDFLGKKTWKLRNFEKKIGIVYKNHGKISIFCLI